MDSLDFALCCQCPYDINQLVRDINWIWEGYEYYIIDININLLLQYDTVCELFIKMYETQNLTRPFAIKLVRDWIQKRNEIIIQYTKSECKQLPDDVVNYIICEYVVSK